MSSASLFRGMLWTRKICMFWFAPRVVVIAVAWSSCSVVGLEIFRFWKRCLRIDFLEVPRSVG